MSDGTISMSASWGPNAALTDCEWRLNPPSLVLACTIHGVRTPADSRDGCGRGPAVLCHVCLRAVVPCRAMCSWTFLCATCTVIERRLAAPFGATALTPHEGWSGTQDSTLYGLRFPDRVYQEVFDDIRVDGRGILLRTHDELDGPNPVLLLGEHARLSLRLLGGDEPVLLDEWLETHPASPRASAEAYVRYVSQCHEWLVREIPRVTEVEWVSAVAGGSGVL